MTDAPSLAEWLLERIAEDEAVARAATPGPWVADVYMGDTDVRDYYAEQGLAMLSGPMVNDSDGEYREEPTWRPEDAAHVARHDPARVLARCAADRRIVEACSAADTMLGDEVLRALASVYADADGFREEWR